MLSAWNRWHQEEFNTVKFLILSVPGGEVVKSGEGPRYAMPEAASYALDAMWNSFNKKTTKFRTFSPVVYGFFPVCVRSVETGTDARDIKCIRVQRWPEAFR